MTEQEKKQAMVDEIAYRLRANTLQIGYDQKYNACQYITAHNARCFIGIHVPLEWLQDDRRWLNSWTMTDFLGLVEEQLPDTAARFPRAGSQFDFDFLTAYQNVHDNAAVEHYDNFNEAVVAGMQRLCHIHGLAWPQDLTVEAPHAEAQ